MLEFLGSVFKQGSDFYYMLMAVLIGGLGVFLLNYLFKVFIRPYTKKIVTWLKALIGAEATDKLTDALGVQSILSGVDLIREIPDSQQVNDCLQIIESETIKMQQFFEKGEKPDPNVKYVRVPAQIVKKGV